MLYAKYTQFLKISFFILKQILLLQLLSFDHSDKALWPIFQMKNFSLLGWLTYFFSWICDGKGTGMVGCLGSPLFPFLILPFSSTLLWYIFPSPWKWIE